MITFTGSQATGKAILTEAGKGLKRVVLELGGKDALIVLDDADIEAAASFAARNSFRNAGQVCVSTEKIYVDKSVEKEFMEAFIAKTKEMQIGAMVHRRQKDHVIGQVKEALGKGAEIAYGELAESDDNVFNPMILVNVNEDMNIMQDETFGPVACVQTVDNDDDAIRMANLGDFGLGGAVFSKDTSRAHNIAKGVKTGMIGINRGPGGAKGSPWVGARGSGYGFHGSAAGHRQLTQIRIISEPK